MNIAVPAFMSPPAVGQLPDWMPIYSATPTVKFAVLNINLDLLNPNDPMFQTNLGVWATMAPALVTQAHAQAPGLLVLGYVPTDNATGAVPGAPILSGQPRAAYRSLAEIMRYVDHWYTLCPTLDGIFFDEGPGSYRFTGETPSTPIPPGYTVVPQIQTLYASLYAHVKTKVGRGTHVMLNASEFMDEWVMGPTGQPAIADTVLLFEGDRAKYEHRYQPQPWIRNYPPDRLLHVIHTCLGYRCLLDREQMIRMVALAQQRGVGLIYVYDGTSSAYNRLTSYWIEQVSAVSNLCGAIRGARDRAFGEILRIIREGVPRLFIGSHLVEAWGCWQVYEEMGRLATTHGC
jgi:hypothetical protein